MDEANSTQGGYIEVSLERGGEYVRVEVPEGATIRALIADDHLRGVEVASTRVNGAPATVDTTIHNGDTVSQVPKSGKQGN